MFRPSGRTQTHLTLCWKSLHGLRNTPKNHCQWTHRCIYTKFELDYAKIQIQQHCCLLTPVWPITTSRGIKRGGTEPVWQNEGASAHMHRGSLCICGGLINAERRNMCCHPDNIFFRKGLAYSTLTLFPHFPTAQLLNRSACRPDLSPSSWNRATGIKNLGTRETNAVVLKGKHLQGLVKRRGDATQR